jgi:K+-transporting ATPase KdpF subunit
MNILYVACGVVAAAILVYLFIALLRPEMFE